MSYGPEDLRRSDAPGALEAFRPVAAGPLFGTALPGGIDPALELRGLVVTIHLQLHARPESHRSLVLQRSHHQHSAIADIKLADAQLTQHRKKYIKNFSSGMRQRVKLALAFTTQSDVLLLDEPTSNFDTKAIDWYQQLIQQYTQDRLLIIGSNQSYEFDCCSEFLPVEQFK